MKATMEISDPLLRQARQWISGRLVKSPTLVLLTETAAHWPALGALLAAGRVTGVLVHDARVAALCRQHGVPELWSADRDLSRFAGLAVVNPLPLVG
jgi:uncharacterized protein